MFLWYRSRIKDQLRVASTPMHLHTSDRDGSGKLPAKNGVDKTEKTVGVDSHKNEHR